MSFGNLKVFRSPVGGLTMILMLLTILAVLQIDLAFTYKIGIIVFSFAVIFLSTLATTILDQAK